MAAYSYPFLQTSPLCSLEPCLKVSIPSLAELKFGCPFRMLLPSLLKGSCACLFSPTLYQGSFQSITALSSLKNPPSKAKLKWQQNRAVVTRVINYSKAQGRFWKNGSSLYLDCGGGYMTLCSKKCLPKGVNFAVCKLYLHLKKKKKALLRKHCFTTLCPSWGLT